MLTQLPHKAALYMTYPLARIEFEEERKWSKQAILPFCDVIAPFPPRKASITAGLCPAAKFRKIQNMLIKDTKCDVRMWEKMKIHREKEIIGSMKEAISKALKQTALLLFSLLFIWAGSFGAKAMEKEKAEILLLRVQANGRLVLEDLQFELEYPDGDKKEYIAKAGYLEGLALYKNEVHILRLKEGQDYEMEELRIKTEGNGTLRTESEEAIVDLHLQRKASAGEAPITLDVIFIREKDSQRSVTIPLTFVFRDAESGQEFAYKGEHGFLGGVALKLEHRYEVELQENPYFTMEKQTLKVGQEGGSYVLFDEYYKRVNDFLLNKKENADAELLLRARESLSKKLEEAEAYVKGKTFSDMAAAEEFGKLLEDARAALQRENESRENLEAFMPKINAGLIKLKALEKQEQPKKEEPKKEEPKQEQPESPKQEELKPENPGNSGKDEAKKESPKPEQPKQEQPKNPSAESGKKSGGSSSGGGSGRRSGGGSGAKGSAKISKKQADKTAKPGAWKQDERGWWYSYKDGSYPKNSWLQDKGKWYYFDSQGYMAKGWVEYSGKWYYLAADGAMLVSATTPDGYKVDAAGVWIR